MAVEILSFPNPRTAVVLGSRFHAQNEVLETGLVAGRTTKSKHVAAVSTTQVRFRWDNQYQAQGETTATSNTIFVQASIEIDGTRYPLLFGGNDEIEVAIDGVLFCDWTTIPQLTPGKEFFIWTFVRVANAAHTCPRGIAVFTSQGEGRASGNFTRTGTPTLGGGPGYGPTIGQGRSLPRPGVAGIGDSIMRGRDDSASWTSHDMGAFTRAFMGRVGLINLGNSSEQASAFALTGSPKRLPILDYCSHAIIEYGTNDIASSISAAGVQSRLTSIISACRTRNVKPILTTILPRVTRVDSGGTWTTANQTPVNSAQFGPGGVRDVVNAWIRSVPPNVYAVLDWSRVVEAASNSSLFIDNVTGDGTHPNSAGHDLLEGFLVDAIVKGVFRLEGS